MPLKDGMIADDAFFGSNQITIKLVGRINRDVWSLSFKWRDEMFEEILRINQVILPTTARSRRKTAAIQQWMQSVIVKMEYNLLSGRPSYVMTR
eukprot:scaffold22171_cov136-Skeletonema_dohrnii-CCMP3373.AAC.3